MGIKFCDSGKKWKEGKKGILVFVLTIFLAFRYKVIMFLNDGLAKNSCSIMAHTLPEKIETSNEKTGRRK